MDITKEQKALVESYARDATVGAGNDSEVVDYRCLESRVWTDFKRPASGAERTVFGHAWARCIQEMAQP